MTMLVGHMGVWCRPIWVVRNVGVLLLRPKVRDQSWVRARSVHQARVQGSLMLPGHTSTTGHHSHHRKVGRLHWHRRVQHGNTLRP